MSPGGWRLYPQQAGLGTAEAHALASADLKQVQALGAEHRARLVEGALWNPRIVAFAPTGGQRISPDEAEALRNDLLALTLPFGGLARGLVSEDDKRAFDAHLAQWLGQHLKVAPGEAAQGAMWAWLGCAVAPELPRWRWPAEGVDYKRFSGNRVRNLFASRWWRWSLLWDESQKSRPAWLLVGLGEDEQVQLTERSSLATNGPLVRAFAGAFLRAADADRGLSRMQVLREATKRLLRLNGLLALDALEPAELGATVEAILSETQAAMGDRGRRSRRAVAPNEEAEQTQTWPELVDAGVFQQTLADPSAERNAEADFRTRFEAGSPAHARANYSVGERETGGSTESTVPVGPEEDRAEPPTTPAAPIAHPGIGRPSAMPDDTPHSLAERLLAGGALGNQAVRELTGWTEVEAREWLLAGVAEGWLLRHGEKRGTRYLLAEHSAPNALDAHFDLPSRLDHVLDSSEGAALPGAPFSTQQREVILLGLERTAVWVADMSANERRAIRHAFATNAAYEEIIKQIRPLLDRAP